MQCDACIKPGETKCPRCDVSDERDPAQLRIEYDEWLQKHFADK